MVVDDEDPARGELAFLLRRSDIVADVQEAPDAATCLALLEKETFDVLFLDVRMPGLDGISLGRVIQRSAQPPRIVFVTAFDEYAVEAFGLAAFDYLLKPIRAERLQVTLERLQQATTPIPGDVATPGQPASEAALGRLAVLSKGQIVLVSIEDIRLAELEGDHVFVHTHEGRYPTRLTLKGVEDRLSGRGFLRVHRRYIVNLRHVQGIETFFNGTYLLRINGMPGVSVPVSRRHGRDLRALVSL
jgi:two-component system LytT family response regulator/two-component system response regulator LytT